MARINPFLVRSEKSSLTYHPAPVSFVIYTLLPIITSDLETRPLPRASSPRYDHSDTSSNFNPSFRRHQLRFLQSSLGFSIVNCLHDIETTPLNHVRCLAIADSSTHAVCISFISQRQLSDPKTIFLGPLGGSPNDNSFLVGRGGVRRSSRSSPRRGVLFSSYYKTRT